MNNIDTGQLIYLVLLGVMVAGWFFMQTRQGLNRTLQYAAVWGMIFVGGAAAVGLWQDISRDAGRPMMTQTSTGDIVVPRSADGHYHLSLDINDTPVRFVLDTGASEMVLTQADAARVGLDLETLNYMGRANTANGQVRTAFVKLDTVTLGNTVDRNVAAVVNEGEMRQSLLGMGYLERWGSLQISNGQLVLSR